MAERNQQSPSSPVIPCSHVALLRCVTSKPSLVYVIGVEAVQKEMDLKSFCRIVRRLTKLFKVDVALKPQPSVQPMFTKRKQSRA